MSGIVKKVIGMAAMQYQKIVAKRLAASGLKLEDLYVETEDVEKALSRIPADVLLERERRIKRAFDLSAKKKYIPEEMQDPNPLGEYLQENITIAKKEREERKLINQY